MCKAEITLQRTCLATHIEYGEFSSNNLLKMTGVAGKIQHAREKCHGIGSNSHAVKYMNQDFESLRRSCLERGQLFEDDYFEPIPSSLGYDELGQNSYKVRGITWKRPTVGKGNVDIS